MQTRMDAQYWTNKYINKETGWDTGSATLPIKQYLDQLENKNLSILFPGAGNAYEAAYANETGFENVYILDISPAPIENFIQEYPNFAHNQIYVKDFFSHKNKYDLIIEQTFFCALPPSQRENYAMHMKSLLNPGGKLVGVLFNRNFEKQGPPFGGTKEEYLSYFEPLFDVEVMETCYNSIKPRAGKELFIKLVNR
jgi:methyl halide transferase